MRVERADLDDAGVVHQDVDAPEAPRRLLDHPLRLVALADVGDDGLDLDVEPCEVGAGALQLRLVAGADRQPTAGLRKLPRDQQPEPARAARDKRDLAAQVGRPQSAHNLASDDAGAAYQEDRL